MSGSEFFQEFDDRNVPQSQFLEFREGIYRLFLVPFLDKTIRQFNVKPVVFGVLLD
jgi:hypothetical protein